MRALQGFEENASLLRGALRIGIDDTGHNAREIAITFFQAKKSLRTCEDTEEKLQNKLDY